MELNQAGYNLSIEWLRQMELAIDGDYSLPYTDTNSSIDLLNSCLIFVTHTKHFSQIRKIATHILKDSYYAKHIEKYKKQLTHIVGATIGRCE